MKADLSAFLRALALRPFFFGDLDCALSLADWWEANHGVDPAAHLRGTYFDEASCGQVIAGAGNLLRLVRSLAAKVGAEPTHRPGPGDFGIVAWEGRYFGAIVAPSGAFAIKAVDGLVLTREAARRRMWKV